MEHPIESRRAQQIITDVHSAALVLAPGYLLRLHGLQSVVALLVGGVGIDHVQVVLSPGLGRCVDELSLLSRKEIALGPPVGHNDAGVAPLAPEDGGQQVVVAGGPVTIDRIIAGHDGVGAALLNRDLEALQVNFTQSPLGNHSLHAVTVGLLIIAGKMLDGSGHIVFVHAPKLRRRHLAGQQRILGEVLEVSAI